MRKLFTFEEMTDSKLELMILFLFSSKKKSKPKNRQPSHIAAIAYKIKRILLQRH